MVTLDQVLLLEKKVEGAVQKIEQLKAENDALRSKCAELTNALSAKTEQFSSFESDQNKIEAGILNALSKLSEIENSIVDISEAGASAQPSESADAHSDGIPEPEENPFVEHFDPPTQEPSSPAAENDSLDATQEMAQADEPASESNDLFTSSEASSGEDLGGTFENVSASAENAGQVPNGGQVSNPFDIF